MSINDITGDKIATKSVTEAYRDNYDRIFRKKPEPAAEGRIVCKTCRMRKPRGAYTSKDGLHLMVNCNSCATELEK